MACKNLNEHSHGSLWAPKVGPFHEHSSPQPVFISALRFCLCCPSPIPPISSNLNSQPSKEGALPGFSWSWEPSLTTLVHTVFPLMLYILAFTPAWHKNTLLSTNVLMLPDCLSSLLSQHVYFIRKQALVCISVIHKVCYIQNGHIILSNEPGPSMNYR